MTWPTLLSNVKQAAADPCFHTNHSLLGLFGRVWISPHTKYNCPTNWKTKPGFPERQLSWEPLSKKKSPMYFPPFYGTSQPTCSYAGGADCIVRWHLLIWSAIQCHLSHVCSHLWAIGRNILGNNPLYLYYIIANFILNYLETTSRHWQMVPAFIQAFILRWIPPDMVLSLSVSEHPVPPMPALSQSTVLYTKCLTGSNEGYYVALCFPI